MNLKLWRIRLTDQSYLRITLKVSYQDQHDSRLTFITNQKQWTRPKIPKHGKNFTKITQQVFWAVRPSLEDQKQKLGIGTGPVKSDTATSVGDLCILDSTPNKIQIYMCIYP